MGDRHKSIEKADARRCNGRSCRNEKPDHYENKNDDPGDQGDTETPELTLCGILLVMQLHPEG